MYAAMLFEDQEGKNVYYAVYNFEKLLKLKLVLLLKVEIWCYWISSPVVKGHQMLFVGIKIKVWYNIDQISQQQLNGA